jgi:hypothetical protein
MLVRCVEARPNDRERDLLGGCYFGPDWSPLDVGEIYLVYGLRLRFGIPWLELMHETSWMFSAPMRLFEIIDDRVSKTWRLHRIGDDQGLEHVLLCPALLEQSFFYDDLSSGVPEAVRSLRELTIELQAEHAQGGRSD